MQFEMNAPPHESQLTSYEQPKTGPPKWVYILIIVGATLGLLLLLLTVITGKNPDADKLEQIVINNSEILRKIEANTQNSKSQDGANYAAIANAIIISDGIRLNTYLNSEIGREVSENKLALAINSEHDDDLAKAALGNTFDDTFQSIIKEDLSQNLALMQELINETTDDSLRVLLQEVSTNQKILL